MTLPFPNEFVPHLMAPLLILKHACAAASGCLYLKRFVASKPVQRNFFRDIRQPGQVERTAK